ncbi:hypothetical protein CZ797_10045 [Pseudoalteromonas sp. JB197]|nr:hypothetical protein CZ797_10045 [Pseudoalteromonas sp. JB197]
MTLIDFINKHKLHSKSHKWHLKAGIWFVSSKIAPISG